MAASNLSPDLDGDAPGPDAALTRHGRQARPEEDAFAVARGGRAALEGGGPLGSHGYFVAASVLVHAAVLGAAMFLGPRAKPERPALPARIEVQMVKLRDPVARGLVPRSGGGGGGGSPGVARAALSPAAVPVPANHPTPAPVPRLVSTPVPLPVPAALPAPAAVPEVARAVEPETATVPATAAVPATTPTPAPLPATAVPTPQVSAAPGGAVKRWRFEPATKEGSAIARQTELAVRFRLDEAM